MNKIVLQIAELACGIGLIIGAFITWHSYNLPGLIAFIAGGTGASLLAHVFGINPNEL